MFVLIFDRLGKDEIFNDPTGRHILVIRRGHMYTFDALNKEGMCISN